MNENVVYVYFPSSDLSFLNQDLFLINIPEKNYIFLKLLRYRLVYTNSYY